MMVLFRSMALVLGICFWSSGSAEAGVMFMSDPNAMRENHPTKWELFAESTGSSVSMQKKNTCAVSVGGYLTGIGFRLPSGVSVSSVSGMPGWELDLTPNVAPFEPVTAAYAVRGNFQGGGNPSLGIAPGEAKVFTLSLTQSITDQMLKTALLGSGGFDNGLVVRFRGLSNGGSNKVGGQGNGGEGQVPEPAFCTALILGSFCCAHVLSRKRRVHKAS